MKSWWLFLLGLYVMVASCGGPSEQKIEEETASGVVLVQNQSFYEVVLPNGHSLYFSRFDEKDGIEGLVTERDSVDVVTSYGTGFFVSSDGRIATNAHVVSNMVADKDVNRSLTRVFEALKEVMAELYNESHTRLAAAQQAYDYANYSPSVSYADFYRIRDVRDAIQRQMEAYAQYYHGLDRIRPSDSEIKYHNRVSVALNNTHVTSTSDFTSCVVVATDAGHDLAIVQLKDKKTPADRHVFDVPEADPLTDYSLVEKLANRLGSDKNSRLYMTGFNLGPTLAMTKEGIKSQFNSGSVSQRTADRLMYSIPALPGSSGAPVVNRKGQLVAVNYAGLNGTQGFNYGIRVKYLRQLLEP